MVIIISTVILLVLLLSMGVNSDQSPCGFHLRYSNGASRYRQIEDDQVIADMREYFPLEDQPSPKVSFQARRDCKLILEYKTSLGKSLMEFPGPFEGLSFAAIDPVSATCSCKKPCRCQDIYLSEGECARAYFDQDCSSCDARFRMIRPGVETRERKWWSSVNSLVLKESCQLMMILEGVQGTQIKLLESNPHPFHKDVQIRGRVKQVNCSCSNPQDTPRNAAPWNFLFPETTVISMTTPSTTEMAEQDPSNKTQEDLPMNLITTTTTGYTTATPMFSTERQSYVIQESSASNATPTFAPEKPTSESQVETTLSTTAAPFPPHFLIGSSYDLKMDEVLEQSNIFEFGPLTRIIGGVEFPQVLNLTHVRIHKSSCMEVLSSPEEFLEERLIELGLPWDTIYGAGYLSSFNDHSCFNIVPDDPSWNKMSGRIDFTLFSLGLSDEVKLGEDFIRDLSLLSPLNNSNFEDVQFWHAFFQTYGTHIVSRVDVGGQLQIKVGFENPKIAEETENTEKIDVFASLMDSINQFVEEATEGNTTSPGKLETSPRVSYKLLQLGGNGALDFSNFSDEADVNALLAWKDSLQNHSTILPSSVKLLPIHEIVRKYLRQGDPQLPSWIEDASLNFLQGISNSSILDKDAAPEGSTIKNLDLILKVNQTLENILNDVELLQSDMALTFNESDKSREKAIIHLETGLKNLTRLLNQTTINKNDNLSWLNVTVQRIHENTQKILDVLQLQNQNDPFPVTRLTKVELEIKKDLQQLRREFGEFIEKKFAILMSYINSKSNRMEGLLGNQVQDIEIEQPSSPDGLSSPGVPPVTRETKIPRNNGDEFEP